MESSTAPTPSQQLPAKTDELLKVFLALLILHALVGLVQGIMGWMSPGENLNPILTIGASILGVAVFVLALVVWVRSVKRKYPKFIRWTAILKVFLPILLVIPGVVLGIALATSIFQDPSQFTIDPANSQAIPAEVASMLKWFSLFPIVNGIFFMGLGAWTWIKLQKS